MLCDYGCGQEANFTFKNGKHCCTKIYSSCLEQRRLSSERNKGKILGPQSEEHRENISKSKKGKKKKPFTKEHRENISKSKKGRKMALPQSIETDELCSFGCGILANYRFKSGNFCCSIRVVDCPKIRQKVTEKQRQWMLDGGAKHIRKAPRNKEKLDIQYKNTKQRMKNGGASYINSFNKSKSKPQKHIFNVVNNLFPNYTVKIDYPFLNYNLDIAILELKIVLEYDGAYWHKDLEKDLERQKEIENLGWKFIRY